jgi:hypothetical protein
MPPRALSRRQGSQRLQKTSARRACNCWRDPQGLDRETLSQSAHLTAHEQ